MHANASLPCQSLLFPLKRSLKLNHQRAVSTNDHDEYFSYCNGFGRAAAAAAGLGIDSSPPRHVSLTDLN